MPSFRKVSRTVDNVCLQLIIGHRQLRKIIGSKSFRYVIILIELKLVWFP